MLGHLGVIVDALAEVDFAVAVEIVKAGELVAAEDVDLRFWAADDPQAQGLKKTGGDSSPGEMVESFVDVGDEPDVAVPCRDRGGLAVGEEIEGAEAHSRFERVADR